MKILLTGGTGFIGSHLAPRLVDQGHEVYSLERYVTTRYALGQHRALRTVFGDLRDASTVRGILRDVRPDVVIHLAAISPVAYSYDHPQEVIDSNLQGTVNLAEACLREVPHLRQFLFASTSEVYGNGPVPKREDTPQRPNSPYAVAKLAAEHYLNYLHDAYDLPVTILRPFNTYGRKADTHFVVEKIVVQMLRGGPVRLGDPDPVRDLLYVDDHVAAYLACLDHPHALGQTFNFATGRGVTIRDLVELVRELTGSDAEVIWHTIPHRPVDIAVLIGDASQARDRLGWAPRVELREGLERTIAWWARTLELPHGRALGRPAHR